MTEPLVLEILADFNPANLEAYLANDRRLPAVDARAYPMGLGAGLLLQRAASGAQGSVVMVWTQPHRVSGAFAALLDGDQVDLSDVMTEVDLFAAGIASVAATARAVLVPTWVLPNGHRAFGLLGMREAAGPVNVLARMNLRLSEQLASSPNVYLLDAQPWLQAAGKDGHNSRLWFMSKIPFGNAVFKEAVADIKAALNAMTGNTRKLVIVDLDNTLWGGVLGDEGWENLRLGGHDAAGEAYLEFQRALKCLTRRGIVLGIVSKNDEAAATEAITRHPEMILRMTDFAGWRINWEDKAENVAALASALNLGLQSVVFIDDNPVERDRVRAALPEVLTPDWPVSPLMFPQALASLDCFDTIAVTDEDRRRATAYQLAAVRTQERDTSGSYDEWLRGLNLKVRVSELNETNVTRVAQLLNKTNQMNLSTRRMTAPEIEAWASAPGHKLWAFRVLDKFEDTGITGIASVAMESDNARIVDFVLSCRVIGRHVEDAMLYQALTYASERGVKMVSAEYIPTPKNGPCLRFLERSGENGNGHVFRWDLQRPFAPPPHIELETATR
jgi:FkbH-like protein